MNSKAPITAKLPKSVHQELLKRIISDGYGMRGKSKWISEAIEGLLKLSNYPELVDIADELEELSDVISIRVTSDLILQLDRAIVTVRKQYPIMEGVKSKIIRASIFQRLLMNFGNRSFV